jgi:caa(3)-type oxidase subunit IV
MNMPEESKKPLTDQQTGDEVKPTPEYTEHESERLPEPEGGVEEAVDTLYEASEAATETPIVKAFDKAVTAVQDAVDSLEPENDPGVSDLRRPMMEAAAAEAGHHDDAHAALLSDTTTVLGREITVPGGIYTVVFGFLAAATVLEVVVGALPTGWFLILLLMTIATIKAILVVAYYMHLRTDSRLFTYILLTPLALAAIAALYLIGVPPTGY